MAPRNQAPVDLTTLGASVPLDAFVWNGPIKNAVDAFPDYNLSREQMAAKIHLLEAQVTRLATLLGVDLNAG